MKVKELRVAIANLPDEDDIIIRVHTEEYLIFCENYNIVLDPGCTEKDVIYLDGSDGSME